MCREWNAVCGTRGLVGGAGVGCVIESRRIQFDARYTGCDYCIVLSSSSSSSLVSARTGSSRRMVDWLVEGAAVATALGGRRSSSSSGPIGYDRDACNGKKKTAPEMSLGKVGWQVGRLAAELHARPVVALAAQVQLVPVARAGCLAGLATCMHASTAFRRLVTAQP